MEIIGNVPASVLDKLSSDVRQIKSYELVCEQNKKSVYPIRNL
jgi:hypothetical protein